MTDPEFQKLLFFLKTKKKIFCGNDWLLKTLKSGNFLPISTILETPKFTATWWIALNIILFSLSNDLYTGVRSSFGLSFFSIFSKVHFNEFLRVGVRFRPHLKISSFTLIYCISPMNNFEIRIPIHSISYCHALISVISTAVMSLIFECCTTRENLGNLLSGEM